MSQISDLSVSLLEKDPRKYVQLLRELLESGKGEEVREKLNEKPYETWYSNHLFSLSRLVGKLNSEAQDREQYVECSFYGSQNVEGIPIDLAKEILTLMVKSGGDIREKDYYGVDVLEYLKGRDSAFYRVENEEYTSFVEKLF
tara:strand:+ start:823 stop:1251 length:429 start_codon:yes stop_codon:yes gene_type:complete